MSTQNIPRRPQTLHRSLGPLWTKTCLTVSEGEGGLIPCQLPLIEAYCNATARVQKLQLLMEMIDEYDPSEMVKLVSAIARAERCMFGLAADLKITPRARAMSPENFRGGRRPKHLKKDPVEKSEKSGSNVHWLDEVESQRA